MLAVVHCLYLAVAVPSMLYAADIFLTPWPEAAARLSREHLPPQQALLAMMGALCSMAANGIEVHADIVATCLLRWGLCHGPSPMRHWHDRTDDPLLEYTALASFLPLPLWSSSVC